MTEPTPDPNCPGCRQLLKLVEELRARIEALEAEVAKLKKTSATSSKPPSSDIVKPKKESRPRRGKGKIGGQPGHSRHERNFRVEDADIRHRYTLKTCPHCGSRKVVVLSSAPRVRFQYEFEEKPVPLHLHEAFASWCEDCEEVHWAELPLEVRKGGLVGPRLSALIAQVKGGCHSSYSTVQTFLAEAMGVSLSRGMIAKVVRKATRALEAPYEELLQKLPGEQTLNVDETGHKEHGKKLWTWCFRAPSYTVFRIDQSRGSDVLFRILGKKFDGVLGCDYFSAYRKYMGKASAQVQFCFAHLIRDVRFLTTLSDRNAKAYGERVLERIRALFRVIHRRERMSPERFHKRLEQARNDLLKTARHGSSRYNAARDIAHRFRKHGEAYFRFITSPGIEPTNNLAEQAIRFVVIDRKVTQGTRGIMGRRWCERIWTVISTCCQQRRSVFDFLQSAISAYFERRAPPSLLRDTS